MKALLLAAGFGTRLRPLTDAIPKCLVPINGRPLLGIWLERLTAAGCGPFLINTHYRAGQVQAFVATSSYLDTVVLEDEPTLLGTAATLRTHLDFFAGADGLLIHADNYCLADFRDFIAAHRRRPAGCVMSMMTFRTDTPSSCGIVTLDDRNVVMDFQEKQLRPRGNLANGAVYIISPTLLEELRDAGPKVTDFSTQVLPALIGRIFAYETSAPLIDIGTPQSYALANTLARRLPQWEPSVLEAKRSNGVDT